MENKTLCPRCKKPLVFKVVNYKSENFLVALCCGSDFAELIADWGLTYTLLTSDEVKSKIAENDLSAYITSTRKSDKEYEKIMIDPVDPVTCFKCRRKIERKDSHIWYHADQDDLLCKECAKGTEHTDTSYAGMLVLEEK